MKYRPKWNGLVNNLSFQKSNNFVSGLNLYVQK